MILFKFYREFKQRYFKAQNQITGNNHKSQILIKKLHYIKQISQISLLQYQWVRVDRYTPDVCFTPLLEPT